MALFSVLRVLFWVLSAAAVFQTVSSIFSFRRHLRIAKKSGLPYVCRFVFEFNYAFLALQPLVTVIINLVPDRLDPSGYRDYYRKDWRVYVKHKKHQELGDVFWNVSPGLLLLEIADADVTTEITTRRTDFMKPHWLFELIRVFGANILDAEEQDWRRHRRVIGPRYNDNLHSFVWDHASRLAREMFADWQRPETIVPYSPKELSREARDLGSLALRVIVGAAFTTFIPFRGATTGATNVRDKETQAATKFAEDLMLVIGNLFSIMIFPKTLIAMSSAKGRQIATAIDDVRYYMSDMLFAEVDRRKEMKKSPENTDPKKMTILSGLADGLAVGTEPGPDQLTYSEAIGNIFLMALAGSATTGDTLHFATVLLALNPDTQRWVCEQLDDVIREEGVEWRYPAVFQKLTRIHDVMMETLRLYPVTPVLPKWTADRAQTLNVDGQAVVLPAKTVVVLSFPAIHYNPKNWGSDVAEFRPQRWAEMTGAPKEGSFVPFSRGARGCLGKRFSETEFTAVLSVCLREHRVELDVGPDETPEHARARAIDALNKSQTYMTLQLGDNVPLRWVRR